MVAKTACVAEVIVEGVEGLGVPNVDEGSNDLPGFIGQDAAHDVRTRIRGNPGVSHWNLYCTRWSTNFREGGVSSISPLVE